MKHQLTASLLIRVGLAFAFLYAGIGAWLEPSNWIGFFPQFIVQSPNVGLFLHIHSVIDIILGLWLLSGKRMFEAGIVAALTLLAIVAVNYKALDIIFRDVALMFAAFALASLHREESRM